MGKTRRKLFGSVMHQEINRAQTANRQMHRALDRMITERPGPQSQLFAVLTTQMAMALTTNLDALTEMERIAVEYAAQERAV